MTFRIHIRPAAKADIASAAAWYEARKPGLGQRFILNTIKSIEALALNALIYRMRHKRFKARWCIPPGFPYLIIYRVEEDLVTVVAVIHAAQKPGEWRSRFRE